MSTHRFPIHHGIRLAGNSFIENLGIEQLAQDPSVIEGIRVWYNTTEKRLKYTSQDAEGAYVIQSIGSFEELDAAIQALQQALTDTDAQLRDYIDGEITQLDDALRQEIRDAVDGGLADLSGAFRYIGKITTSGGASEAEAVDLSTLDLTDTETGAYYKIDAGGWFKVTAEAAPFYVNKGDGITYNNAGDIDIFDNTNSEVEGTEGEIDVEGSVDTGFTVKLAEDTRQKLAQIQTLVDTLGQVQTELSDVIDAVQALTQAVGDIETLETEEKSSLTAAVNELHTKVQAAEGLETLKDDLNAQVFSFESEAGGNPSQTEYVVEHNLGTELVHVTLWVKDPSDGIYYNDIISAGVVDGNTVRVTLSEARHIRIIIRSAAALA